MEKVGYGLLLVLGTILTIAGVYAFGWALATGFFWIFVAPFLWLGPGGFVLLIGAWLAIKGVGALIDKRNGLKG